MDSQSGTADPVRWGILGAGRISSIALGPAIGAAPSATLVAVAARDPLRAARLDPNARVYTNYADLLADPDVEVVYCALPNDAHLPWTLAALAEGKHVLCEKPLAMDAGQVDVAADAAERAGRRVVEASWYRWHPRTQKARALLVEGSIGAIRHVDAGFTFSGVPESDYRMDPAMGGGALYDVGCYALSAVGWALDWAALDVVDVKTRMAATGVDLFVEASLRAKSGRNATATIRAAFDEPERQWLSISGDRGTLRFGSPAFSAWSADTATLEVDRLGSTSTHSFPGCNPYLLMVENMCRAVRGESSWVLPISESRAVAALIDAIRALS